MPQYGLQMKKRTEHQRNYLPDKITMSNSENFQVLESNWNFVQLNRNEENIRVLKYVDYRRSENRHKKSYQKVKYNSEASI